MINKKESHKHWRPLGLKSTSATSGNQGFLLRGAQIMARLSGRDKKQPVPWHIGLGRWAR